MTKDMLDEESVLNQFKNTLLLFFDMLNMGSIRVRGGHYDISVKKLVEDKSSFGISFCEAGIEGRTYVGVEDGRPYFNRISNCGVLKKHTEDHALAYLEGLLFDKDGQVKKPDLLSKPIAASTVSQDDDRMLIERDNATFLNKWVADSVDADVVIISIGSHMTGSHTIEEQQEPTFATEARKEGKKVRILNIDPLFSLEKPKHEDTTFLNSIWGDERYPATNHLVQNFVLEASKKQDALVVLSTYCDPYSHKKFAPILKKCQEVDRVVCLQGYWNSYNPVIILDKQKVVADDYRKEGCYESLWTAKEPGKEDFQKIVDDYRKNDPNAVGKDRIFYRLSDLKFKDLQRIIQEDKATTPSTCPKLCGKMTALMAFTTKVINRMLGGSSSRVTPDGGGESRN